MTIFDNIKCPHCGAYHCIKWGTYCRYVVFKYNKRKKIIVQRYKCKVCDKTFNDLPDDVMPRLKYSRSAIIQMLEWKYLHGAGLRKAGKVSDRETIYSSSTIWKYIQRVGPKSMANLKNIKIPFSGIITADETYYKCKGGICVYIVVSAVCEDKSGKYTVILATEEFQVKLSEDAKIDKRKAKKEIREKLSPQIEKVLQNVADRFGVTCVNMVLTDDDPIYSTIVRKIFPFAVHKICLWHIIKNIIKALQKELGNSKYIQEIIEWLNCLWITKTWWEAMQIVENILQTVIRISKKIARRIIKLKTRIFENKVGLFDFRTNNPSEWTFARIDPLIKVIKSFQSDDGMKNYLHNVAMYYNFSSFVDGAHKGKSPIELVCPLGADIGKNTPFWYI